MDIKGLGGAVLNWWRRISPGRWPGGTGWPGRESPDPGFPRQAWWLELTPRERQVAEQVSRGTTDRQIARHLEISPRTVHIHLEQIYRKLGLPGRASLIALSLTTPADR